MSIAEPALPSTDVADVEARGSSSQGPVLGVSNPSLRNPLQYQVRLVSDDPENPRYWPFWYKSLTVITISLGATVVSLFSTVYTSGIPGLEDEFGTSKIVALLGVPTYLLGMAIGTIVSAPLSEVVGRRPVYLVSMALFLVLVLPSALAHNIEAILIGRFFGGLFGSAIMGNSPASVNDVVTDEHRAMALGIWSIGPTNGPVYGPIIGGFVFEYLGWRWTNWIVLIIGGVVFVLMCCIKETYAPVILRKRATRLREETGNPQWWTQYDGDLQLSSLLKTSLSRPFVMLFTEPICMFWSIYIALVYGVLYLCFVAYPIAFQTTRGWSPGFTGVSFTGIGVGTLLVIAAEPLFRRIIHAHTKDPETDTVPPEAMASIIVFGATLLAIGQLWFAWTCTPWRAHWIVPILAGLPFGAGNACVFIYASNYIARSYDIYTASAMAGNMFLRSLVGAFLLLAGPAMYRSLGLNWGSTLLGLVEAGCISVPVVFYFYGHRIRRASPMIRELERMKGVL
ncbi:MFS general substrate transporter [Aspergillus germanicus]